jgi:SagB-type dehydrogenase family enzyme
MIESEYLLRLREGTQLQGSDGQLAVQGPLVAASPRAGVTFRQLSPALDAALRRLAGAGATQGELGADVIDADGPEGLFKLTHFLGKLQELNLLVYGLPAEQGAHATLVPLSERFALKPRVEDPAARFVLSRFALIRREGTRTLLESPLAPAQLVLETASAVRLVLALHAPQDAAGLAQASALDLASVGLFLALLLSAGALSSVDAQGAIAEDGGDALPLWDFHDLYYHSRSRVGRHGNPVGGTYRFAGKLAPLPALAPRAPGETIELHRPDLDELKRADRRFTEVLEERRSIREHGDQPISERELGEFLFRAARVRQFVSNEKGELTSRPYPGGGALYELEIYPVVDRCQGIAPGLYHYEPLAHRLRLVAGRTPAVAALLQMAYYTADQRSHPHVLLVFAARFQRVQWKYQSVSYAVILKDVGVLQQTMYLVATAMGLAPCALGGGNSDLFADAAGLDYYRETSVGEFILGRPAVS